MSQTANDNKPLISVFIPNFGQGGVERMMVHLARGFSELGFPVDFVVAQDGLPFLDRLGPAVERVSLARCPDAADGPAAAYLRRHQPAIMLTAKDRDSASALAARQRTGHQVGIYMRVGTHLSGRSRLRSHNPLRRWWERQRLRRLYGALDGIICNARGVADDLSRVTGLSRDRLHVIRNPSVPPDLAHLLTPPPAHPWFAAGQPPVVLAAGRLARVKRFDVLLRAMARVMAARPARLVILGEGREQAALERLAGELGIAHRVALPGFCDNPYPWMAAAAVFVLSSEREGSPNVLAEALAVGTPVVASDCPSGPREILQDGRHGPLVPVGDDDALARAILATLDNPPARDRLREAVEDYTLPRASRAYLQAFGLQP